MHLSVFSSKSHHDQRQRRNPSRPHPRLRAHYGGLWRKAPRGLKGGYTTIFAEAKSCPPAAREEKKPAADGRNEGKITRAVTVTGDESDFPLDPTPTLVQQ
jgi:hypothetical protein